MGCCLLYSIRIYLLIYRTIILKVNTHYFKGKNDLNIFLHDLKSHSHK